MTSIYQLLPPLTEEEFAGLKADIERNGQQVPIVRDQRGVTIDGHHRERALRELGVPEREWLIDQRPIASEEDGGRLFLSLNVHRRQGVDKKRVAIDLYQEKNWTQEQIGEALGVGRTTVRDYLADIWQPLPNAPPREGLDTLGRKKSTGRPKGSKNKPKATTASPPPDNPASDMKPKKPRTVSDLGHRGRVANVDIHDVSVEEWNAFVEMAFAAGKDSTDAISDLVKAALHNPPAPQLSASAQARFDTALRQHKRKLEFEFEARSRERAQALLEEFILPSYHRRIEEANRIVKTRRGALKASEYNKLRKCLHTDTLAGVRERAKRGEADDATDRLFNEAFQMISDHRLILLSEKEAPTEAVTIPRTRAEMEAAKARATEARKAARAAAAARRANGSRPTLAH